MIMSSNCSELNVEAAKANQYADEAQKAKKPVALP